MKYVEIIKYYSGVNVNRSILSKINYLDGKKNGVSINYFRSGDIESKSWYLDGKRNGEYIKYFISGDIKCKCNYIDGEVHGEYIYYYINGEVECKYYYICSNEITELDWISYNRNIKLELLGL